MDGVPEQDLVVPRGLERTIAYARDAAGNRPAWDFLCSPLGVGERARLVFLFRRLADTGRIPDQGQFRKESGEIWSFKTHGGIRIAAFPHKRVWFLTHGLIKKRDRWPRTELERAERIRAEHLLRWIRTRTEP